MNSEINKNDDIFDIAIAMKYFGNRISSADNIHTYATHFLYKSVYQKLLSFSKDELETSFVDSNNKIVNPKIPHDVRFHENIFHLNNSIRNPLFFGAFIEKNAFKKLYNPVVKFILSNKKTAHSLDFLETLFSIQTSRKMNDNEDSVKNLIEFDSTIFNFCKKLDTEEKNEIFLIFINKIIKNKPEDFVSFVLGHINSFNDEHLLILQSKIKEFNIDINAYKLFEEKFPKDGDSSFFISSLSHDSLDNAYNFGFRANSYQYKKLSLVCAIYSHGLNGNNIGDTWQTAFIKKNLINSDLATIDSFLEHIGHDSVKLKKYGSHFENIGKEALNESLQVKLPEVPKVKRSKI